MELFWLEHKKLWRKKIVKICVLLCFVYYVIFGSILSFQWFGFGSSDDYTSAFGNNFDGYTVIKDSQEYALSFGGELTDETLQQIVSDYQQMEADGMEKELEKTDWQIERKVEKPFRYEWVEGWSTLLGSMVADLGVVMALFLGIVLSSLFAGEWHDNTSTLVLTTRNGWGKIALAKILTGLAFTVELFALLAVSNVISQLFFMGTAGWDMPIQNIKLIAVAPMNMLQAEIYEYAFVLLGAIGFAGIVMFISAAVKNNVLTLLLSLAVVYGPMMIAEYLPYGMQKALDLIPLVGSSTDIFRTNTFRILGKLIWSPYLLITIPVLIGILCMPFAIKSWSRRMKA